MADTALRLAERSLALGEPGARERLILERMRAGAPDPRVDPVGGAEIAASKYTGRYCSRVERQVVRTWPGRLAVDVPAFPRAEWDAAPLSAPHWLTRGTPILSVTVRTHRTLGGGRAPDTWLVVAEESPGRWREYVVCEEPEVVDQSARGLCGNTWLDHWLPLEVEAIEWQHPTGRRKPQRSTLAQWRRWARGGTVLHLGRGA